MGLLADFQRWLTDIGLPHWAAYVVPALAGIIVALLFLFIMIIVFIYLERRGLGRFQIRPGPNRAGPFGILQAFADFIKVLTKEDITPTAADRPVHFLAPVVAFFSAIMILAVIPIQGNAFITNLNIGILYVSAISSLGAIAIFMAGFGSCNKYSLIAAMRGVAQLISYEVPVLLAIAGVLLISGSLAMGDIIRSQNVPFILLQPLGFLIFFTGVASELNRSPFDLMEAESEIVTGYHIEYSGMKFALFYLGEYGHMVVASAVMTTLYLSGWKGPFLPPALWFLIKMVLVFLVFLWLRATMPRIRVDQLMSLAWKFLLPLALLNLFTTAAEVLWQDNMGWEQFPWPFVFLNLGLTAIFILVGSKLLFKTGGGQVEV
jgi:NADH-quinone oxidoreductase subunit H